MDDATIQAMGGYARMKPPLAIPADQTALWAGLADQTIDLVETDHAPHTKAEKDSATPPFGVPGLETAALLLFKAEREGRLTITDIERFLYESPKRVFKISDQPETYVEFNLDTPSVIGAKGYRTKAGWSPFDGWTVPAYLTQVVLRGQKV